MVDYKKIMYGLLAFIAGYFYALLSDFVAIPLLDSIESAFTTSFGLATSNTISGIIWFGLIVTWILAILVVPIAFTMMGLLEINTYQNKYMGMITGVLHGVFALAVSVFTWFWVTTLIGVVEQQIIQVLIWIGLLYMYVFNIGVIPAHAIIKAREG